MRKKNKNTFGCVCYMVISYEGASILSPCKFKNSCEKNAVDGNFSIKGNKEVEKERFKTEGRRIRINDFKKLQTEKRTMGKLIQLERPLMSLHIIPSS